MSSPVTPQQAADLVPTASTEPCTAIRSLFFTLPKLFSDFLGWLLNADGTLSDGLLRDVFKPGMIMGFGGVDAPAGWLICDGREIKRADYPELFAAIGTTWGSGDGVTTFLIPNGKRKALVGSDVTSAKFGIGTMAGEEEVLLTAPQTALVGHSHEVTIEQSTVTSTSQAGRFNAAGADLEWNPNISLDTIGYTRPVDGTPAAEAHNNLSPYFAGNWIIKI